MLKTDISESKASMSVLEVLEGKEGNEGKEERGWLEVGFWRPRSWLDSYKGIQCVDHLLEA